MARINFQSMDLFRDIQEDQNLFYSGKMVINKVVVTIQM